VAHEKEEWQGLLGDLGKRRRGFVPRGILKRRGEDNI
jgi:hypothetical protein